MIRSFLWCFLALTSWAALAQATTLEETLILQNSALIDRLNLTLGARVPMLKKCDAEFYQRVLNLNSKIQKADLNNSQQIKLQATYLQQLLNALRDSKNIEQRCLGKAEIKSVRTAFAFSENTENPENPTNRLWWKVLEPACYKVRLKGKLNNADGNACFGGDRVVVKTFQKQNIDLPTTSLRFSYALLAGLANTDIKGRFKIETAFQNEFNSNDPKLLLSALAAIGSSGPSGFTGWLQGIEDRILIQDLNSEKTNQEILKRFEDLQLAKFNYIVFRDTADKYKVRLSLYGQDFTDWNRHNVMSAFLGCSLRWSFEKQTPSLIYMTGVAYETKDFFSHLAEGVSLAASRKNFVEDTHRYKISGQFGYDLCPQK